MKYGERRFKKDSKNILDEEISRIVTGLEDLKVIQERQMEQMDIMMNKKRHIGIMMDDTRQIDTMMNDKRPMEIMMNNKRQMEIMMNDKNDPRYNQNPTRFCKFCKCSGHTPEYC
jgi:hypothetical protein